jgi:hypothetical protein
MTMRALVGVVVVLAGCRSDDNQVRLEMRAIGLGSGRPQTSSPAVLPTTVDPGDWGWTR